MTGATGFVGSAIVPELIGAGHQVLGLAGSDAAAAETDRPAMEAIGAVLAGSDRPFIVTSGTALTSPGRVATEEDAAKSKFPRKSEEAAASAAAHRFDAARFYRLVLDKSPVAPRYHAVADQGVPFREIAQVIGGRLNIPVVSKSPEEAADRFGWFAHFAGLDCPACSAQTREALGWPTQPLLISDIDQPSYFEPNQKTFDQTAGATK